MNHMIDRLIHRTRQSTLSPERKAQAIRILESLRNALQAIHRFVHGLIAAVQAHHDAARILVIAILLATLAHAIPWIGNVLGLLVVLMGVAAAFVVELRQTLNGLFELGT